MSRRQTLGSLSPAQLNSRANPAVNKSGKQPDGKQGTKPPAGRHSMAPRLSERASIGFDRRSSTFGKPTGIKQDPRPLSDKNFQAACIRTVITYLSTHGYPYAVSPKLLTSPTGKDFAQIVLFLFQRFDPNLKSFGKVEDEVPVLFKRLNYPFQISKSALFAVGSPHSWPSVLAALTWLVELLNYEDKAESAAAAASSSFDDRQRAERQFYQYVATSYRYFLAGEDHKCAAADDEMLGQFREREGAHMADIAKLKQATEQLQRESEQLRAAPRPLLQAQQQHTDCLSDKAKFESVIANCQTTKANLQRRITERQADVNSRKAALAQLQADNAALAERVAGQALSKADVNRMQAERSTQRSILESVTAQREQLERQAYEQEVQVEGALKSLEEAVRQYNLAAHSLALVPVSAKRADGAAYEISLDRGAASAGELVNVDLKGCVKPGLASLRERYRGRARDLGEDALGLEEALDVAREAAEQRAEEVAAAQAQAARLEERYREMKEEVEAGLKARAAEAEALKGRVTALRGEAVGRLRATEEAVRAAKEQFDALVRSCTAEAHQLNTRLMAALNLMLQHATDMQQGVREVQATVGAAVADMLPPSVVTP